MLFREPIKTVDTSKPYFIAQDLGGWWYISHLSEEWQFLPIILVGCRFRLWE